LQVVADDASNAILVLGTEPELAASEIRLLQG